MNRLTDIDLGGLDCLESVDVSYNQLNQLNSGWIGGGGGTEDIQVIISILIGNTVRQCDLRCAVKLWQHSRSFEARLLLEQINCTVCL